MARCCDSGYVLAAWARVCGLGYVDSVYGAEKKVGLARVKVVSGNMINQTRQADK